MPRLERRSLAKTARQLLISRVTGQVDLIGFRLSDSRVYQELLRGAATFRGWDS